MLEIIRNHPFGAAVTALLVLTYCMVAFTIGSAVLYWMVKALNWLIPKLDAAALDVVAKLRG